MDLLRTAGDAAELTYRVEGGSVDGLPAELLDAALDILAAGARSTAHGVDAELVVTRTFDRKGHLTTGTPCSERNPSYSGGDSDGYLVALVVHFEPHHRHLDGERAALDEALATITRSRTEAKVAELTAALEAADAHHAQVAQQLEEARAAALESS